MKKSQLKQIIKEEISKILKEDSTGMVGSMYGENEYLRYKNEPYLDNNIRKPLKNTDHARHYVHSNVSDVANLREESNYTTVEDIIGEFFQHFFVGTRRANDETFLKNYIEALGRETQYARDLLKNIASSKSNITGVNL
tara:strand:- start:60 stop:476 length:417 start_codon:yes stop_codon:yes gene_type:complete